mgnify:CR=1 FL=1|tara:strand:- start:295 stop:690 length:396 start_codon:yes stop_codon:yes gene_type:complete
MTKFFSNYKIIFYSLNCCLLILYLFPGSLLGCFLYNDCKIQPQITRDLIISSNHLYAFALLSVIGFISYKESKKIKILIIYLIFLSIILEVSHIVIPERSYQWSDLFGNLLGVILVIFFFNLNKKYEFFKK